MKGDLLLDLIIFLILLIFIIPALIILAFLSFAGLIVFSGFFIIFPFSYPLITIGIIFLIIIVAVGHT